MIEAFAEHPGLHDGVQLVIFELLENLLVGLRFARMNVSGTKPARGRLR
jgi:hypothetical protein